VHWSQGIVSSLTPLEFPEEKDGRDETAVNMSGRKEEGSKLIKAKPHGLSVEEITLGSQG